MEGSSLNGSAVVVGLVGGGRSLIVSFRMDLVWRGIEFGKQRRREWEGTERKWRMGNQIKEEQRGGSTILEG